MFPRSTRVMSQAMVINNKRKRNDMPDVFISHSSKDAELASKLQGQLKDKGVDAFVASKSIAPGEKWSPEIKAKLAEAEYVLFLATPDSCVSPAVNQELGGTMFSGKPLIPILCGVPPEQLPAWTKEHQAVDLHKEPERVDGLFTRFARWLDLRDFWKWLIGGIVVTVGLWVVVKALKPRWLFGCLALAILFWLAKKPSARSCASASLA